MSKPRGPQKRFSPTPILVQATIVVMALAGLAHAQRTTASFEEANRSFAEGRYAAAAAGFESLAHTRGWSAPLLYDLANTYAQEGHVGPAILSYERARLLAPRDPDIAANLAYVRARAGLPNTRPTWYRTAASYLAPAAWTWSAAIALWIAAASLLAARKWRKRLLIYAGGAALLLGAAGLAAIGVSEQASDRAVVVESKSAPVRVSPFDGAASESSLSEGEMIAVLGRHGDFVHVRDSRGHTGWVQSAAVQTIVPRTS